jgi:hypothetical protein
MRTYILIFLGSFQQLYELTEIELPRCFPVSRLRLERSGRGLTQDENGAEFFQNNFASENNISHD